MERLPAKILISIGEYTREEYEPTKALRALSLCSRRFHALFQPSLYRYIRPYWARSTPIKWVNLVIRLWKNPDLASHVRHLKLCWFGCEYGPCDGQDEVTGFIDDALDGIFEPEEEKTKARWRKHLHHSCDEAWIGLLLVRLTHLQTIEFQHENSHIVSDILRKAAQRQRPFHQAPPFPYLREVLAFNGWGVNEYIYSDFLMPFFYFPAVRKIHGGTIIEEEEHPENELDDEEEYDDYKAEKKPLDISHSSRPVREFTVDFAYWSAGMLDWLAACTELEHIDINIARHRDSYHWEEPHFDAPSYRQALLPFSETLRTLHIHYNGRYKEGLKEAKASDPPFGSFKEFTVLQDLSVRHAHLMRSSSSGSMICRNRKPLVDLLPTSLKSLAIKDIVEDGYQDLLFELSRFVQHRESFPRLEQISLYVQEEDEDLVDFLRMECETAGICLNVEMQEDEW